MERRAVIVLALILGASCAVPPEYSILQRFFSASRLRDTTALHDIATIVFEPREQGTVSTFDITGVAVHRDGNRESKDVTVSAVVRLPTRYTVRQTLVLTLEHLEGTW